VPGLSRFRPRAFCFHLALARTPVLGLSLTLRGEEGSLPLRHRLRERRKGIRDVRHGGAVGGEEGEAKDGADRPDDAAGTDAVHHPRHLRRRQGARPAHHLRRLGPRQGKRTPRTHATCSTECLFSGLFLFLPFFFKKEKERVTHLAFGKSISTWVPMAGA
jgi:hypothetical protein